MLFSESLKKNKDFQNVYRKGRSQANKYLVMYLWQNDLGRNRLGISVSKKVGNSVVRHHLTRLVRESYRLNEEKFQCGYDLVAVVRPRAKECSYHEIECALLHAGKLHGIRTDLPETDQNQIFEEKANIHEKASDRNDKVL